MVTSLEDDFHAPLDPRLQRREEKSGVVWSTEYGQWPREAIFAVLRAVTSNHTSEAQRSQSLASCDFCYS